MKYNRKQWIAILLTVFIWCPVVSCGTVAYAAPLEITTDCCTLHIDSDDLVDFSRSIAPSPLEAWIFPKPVAEQVDLMFAEIQALLGLSATFPKVSIYVYSTKEDMHETLLRLKNSNLLRGYNKEHRAAYLRTTNSIYMTIEDVNRRIIAHEMTHAIYRNYFPVQPPPVFGEIVARYVGGKF